jgi:hypothetical protein
MLRGLTGSGVAVTGAQFIDNLKQRLPCILNYASGDMLARKTHKLEKKVAKPTV